MAGTIRVGEFFANALEMLGQSRGCNASPASSRPTRTIDHQPHPGRMIFR